MQTVQVFNVTKGAVLVGQAQVAASLSQRMRGLLGRSGLGPNEGLILKPCSSIHTFLMRFAIDVLFVDKNMRIIKIVQNIPPNRLSPIAWSSCMAIELPAGKTNQTSPQVGDKLEFRSCK